MRKFLYTLAPAAVRLADRESQAPAKNGSPQGCREGRGQSAAETDQVRRTPDLAGLGNCFRKAACKIRGPIDMPKVRGVH